MKSHMDQVDQGLTELLRRYNQMIPMLESLGSTDLAQDLEEGIEIFTACQVHLRTIGFSVRELLIENDERSGTEMKDAVLHGLCSRQILNSLLFFAGTLRDNREYVEQTWIDYTSWAACLKPTRKLTEWNLHELFIGEIKEVQSESQDCCIPILIFWNIGDPKKYSWVPELETPKERIEVFSRTPALTLPNGPE